MKILIKGFKKAVTELKLFYFTSFILAILVIIPISNFLLEGVQYILSGNFSLGIAGGEEVLGTLKVLILTSFLAAGWELWMDGYFQIVILSSEKFSVFVS